MYRILLFLLIVSCAQPFRKPPTFLTKRVKTVKQTKSWSDSNTFYHLAVEGDSAKAWAKIVDVKGTFNPIIEHSEIREEGTTLTGWGGPTELDGSLSECAALQKWIGVDTADPRALRFYDPNTGRVYDSVPECKHIWVNECFADSIVCIKCFKQEGKIQWGGTLTTDSTTTYYLHVDTTSGKITYDSLLPAHPILPRDIITVGNGLSGDSAQEYALFYNYDDKITYGECEADCYSDWCCVCNMSENDPRHQQHTPPLIPCH
jgi:hypothetical protein